MTDRPWQCKNGHLLPDPLLGHSNKMLLHCQNWRCWLLKCLLPCKSKILENCSDRVLLDGAKRMENLVELQYKTQYLKKNLNINWTWNPINTASTFILYGKIGHNWMKDTIQEIHRILRIKVIRKTVFYVLYLKFLFANKCHLNTPAGGCIAK